MSRNTQHVSPQKIKEITYLGNISFSFQRPPITENNKKLTPLSQNFFADFMNEDASS